MADSISSIVPRYLKQFVSNLNNFLYSKFYYNIFFYLHSVQEVEGDHSFLLSMVALVLKTIYNFYISINFPHYLH